MPKIPKNAVKVRERLRKFLIRYYELDPAVYVDKVLFEWKKGVLHWTVDVFANGLFISLALIPFDYLSVGWLQVLVNLPCLGILSWLVRGGAKWWKRLK